MRIRQKRKLVPVRRFVVGLLSQTLIVHMIRCRRLPFIQSRAAATLMAMTLLVMVVGSRCRFRRGVLPAVARRCQISYFPWLCYSGGLYDVNGLVKGFYSRRYG